MNCILDKALLEDNEDIIVKTFRQENADNLANKLGKDLKITKGWEGEHYNFNLMTKICSVFDNPRIDCFGRKGLLRGIDLYKFADEVKKKVHYNLFDHCITLRMKKGKSWQIIGYGFSPYISHINNPKKVITDILKKAIHIMTDSYKLDDYSIYTLDTKNNLHFPLRAMTFLFLRDDIITDSLNTKDDATVTVDNEKIDTLYLADKSYTPKLFVPPIINE